MSTENSEFILRPSIINKGLWFPERPNKSEWNRIRNVVLERDGWKCLGCDHVAHKWMQVHHARESEDNDPSNLISLCVACHAVLHIGLNLMHGGIEIWQTDVTQKEIIQRTRQGIREGLTLEQINAVFKLTPGKHPAGSTDYANDLILTMGDKPRAYLPEPLCAIFVNFQRWQIED